VKDRRVASADRRPVDRRELPPQPQPDAERAYGRAKKHGLDLRQPQFPGLRHLQPTALRHHKHNHPRPKCLTKALRPKVEERLRSLDHLKLTTKSASTIEEVTEHPILHLLNQPNPIRNSFDLWELTTLYQKVHGSAYWYLEHDAFYKRPAKIWVMPSQNMKHGRNANSGRRMWTRIFLKRST
jgi:Phage portal protein